MTLKRTTRLLLRLPPWVQRLGEHAAARTVPHDFPELSEPRAAKERSPVALIVVWLGPVPAYMPAFLRSAAANPGFDWLIFADWDVHALDLPPNVRLFRASRARIAARCFRTLGFVPALLDPNKLCDLRPQYSRIFAREIAGYVYWGFCDLDCVWGDLDAAYGDPIRDGVDVVTSRQEVLAGHFTAVRAGSPIEEIAHHDARLRADMRNPKHVWADEERFSELVREAARAGTIRVHWPDCIVGDGDIVGPDKLGPEPWCWRDGRVTYLGREFAYLHFMHWKHRPEFGCALDPGDPDGAFTVTAAGITQPVQSE